MNALTDKAHQISVLAQDIAAKHGELDMMTADLKNMVQEYMALLPQVNGQAIQPPVQSENVVQFPTMKGNA